MDVINNAPMTYLTLNRQRQSDGRTWKEVLYLVDVMAVVVATDEDVSTPLVVSVAVVALAVEDAGPKKDSIIS